MRQWLFPLMLGVTGLGAAFSYEEMGQEDQTPSYRASETTECKVDKDQLFYSSTEVQVGVDSLTLTGAGFVQPTQTGISHQLATGPKFTLAQTFEWKDILFLKLTGSITQGISQALPAVTTIDGEPFYRTSYHSFLTAYRAESLLGHSFSLIKGFLLIDPYVAFGAYWYKSKIRGFTGENFPDQKLFKMHFFSPKIGFDLRFLPTTRTFLSFGLGMEFPHSFLNIIDLQDSVFDSTVTNHLSASRHGINAAARAGYRCSKHFSINGSVEFYSLCVSGSYIGLGSADSERAITRVESTSFNLGASFDF